MVDHPSTLLRPDDLLRHLRDLRTHTHEGAVSRSDKEALYRRAVDLLTPVARSVLDAANAAFLDGTGDVRVVGPVDDGYGGLVSMFELSWPEQRAGSVVRGPRGPLQPVRIVAHYGDTFHHPHLAASDIGDWPLQVTSPADARRQEGVLAAIVERELHQRIYESDWHIIPAARRDDVDRGRDTSGDGGGDDRP